VKGRRRIRALWPRSLVVAAALAWLLVASPSAAHVIPGAATLSQLARAASVVAVAKIVNPHAMLELGDAKVRRFVVEAEVVEVLRGDVGKGPVKFVPHGHGAEAYEAGEETLLFLQPIEQNRDLAGTKLASAVRFAGIDEVADRITLRPSNRGVFLDAARAYAAVASIASEAAEAQRDALRRTTLRLLTSKEPRLAGFALKDLALSSAEAGSLVTAEDLPALLAVLDDASRPLSLRVGLLTELERRKLVVGAERWVRLLREAPPAEVSTVARMAGRRGLPEVTAELVRLLQGENGQAAAAAAAAAALGAPGNEAAVEPLGRAVWGPDAKLRWTALQSLGRIASPAARAVLARAASDHPDEETRRAAQTEINLLAARQSAPAASGRAPGEDRTQSQAGSSGPSSSFFRDHWKALAIVGAALIAAGVLFIRRRRERGSGPTRS
jgi:LPXTG-motif cell wall-anchored protein